MRHDHNASLWATPVPRGRKLLRRLAFAGVGVAVTVVAGMPLVEQARPLSAVAECTPARSDVDADCVRDGSAGAVTTQPIRVIGIERNAPAVVVAERAAPEPLVPPAPVAGSVASAPAAVHEPAARTVPSTDGSGRIVTVVQSQPVTSMPLSDEELTFKAGALHRPGAVVATKDDAVKPPATPKTARIAKPRRAVTQTYDMPDGRRVTVHRGYRDDNADGRQAEAGRRYGESFGGFYGERRNAWGGGGLY